MGDLNFQVTDVPGGQLLTVTGELDETADFSRATIQSTGELTIDLGGVKRINSCGVREWVNFIRAATASRPVRLVRCSVPMVEQLNMVFNFRASASIESVMAPFCCSACGAMTTVLLQANAIPAGGPPDHKCGSCGGVSTFDDMPERYFAFLSDGT